MFGLKELKENIKITGDIIECPVKGCKNKVRKITKKIVRLLDSALEKGNPRKEFEEYLCKEHRIYITPSTFIYENLKDNLLWYEYDKDLLNDILKAKRVKAQLHHDNSEDAVTWNVFRFLETNGLLAGFLSKLRKQQVANPEVIYWSYSQSQRSAWNKLAEARNEFGEEPEKSSEPDLVMITDDALFFLEAKLTSSNKQDFNRGHTAEQKEERIERYSEHGHYPRVLVESAIDDGYYQLMRLWLIGSRIGGSKSDFYLVNIVLSEQEKEIERIFGQYIRDGGNRAFIRTTWESIYDYIKSSSISDREKKQICGYFENKAARYDRKGILTKAFSV